MQSSFLFSMKRNLITICGEKYGSFILTANNRRYYLDLEHSKTQFFENQRVAYWQLMKTQSGQYQIVGRIFAQS